VAKAWLGVTAKGFSQNQVQFVCTKVGWVVICSIMEVLGGFRMVGLVFLFDLGRQYGVQRWLVGPLGWSWGLWLAEGGRNWFGHSV